MSASILMLAARIALAVCLYAFLALILIVLWRDLRAAQTFGAARGRSPILQRIEEAGAPKPPFSLSKDSCLIGRSRSVEIPLADETVSAVHARIWKEGGRWWLEDLDFRNGTFLNQIPVEKSAVLCSGDRIRVGRIRARVPRRGFHRGAQLAAVRGTARMTHRSRLEAALLGLGFAFQAVNATALLLAPSVQDGRWNFHPANLAAFVPLAVWGAAAWIVHRQLDRTLPGRDPFLFSTAMFLCGWGLQILVRLSPITALRQTLWLAVGCAAVIIFLNLPHDLDWLRKYRYLWLGAVLLTLGATLLVGVGAEPGSARLVAGLERHLFSTVGIPALDASGFCRLHAGARFGFLRRPPPKGRASRGSIRRGGRRAAPSPAGPGRRGFITGRDCGRALSRLSPADPSAPGDFADRFHAGSRVRR